MLSGAWVPAGAAGYASDPDVDAFIRDMVRHHAFTEEHLRALFTGAERQERVLDVIQRPAEAKPWHEYRPIFVTSRRIREGARFWRNHEGLLQEVARAYDVDPAIVVAILGVETYYGKRTGSFPVFSTLTTLGFEYPPRDDFFRSELEQFLLLTREEGMDPMGLEGSYAGAMGKGQFIPSSYRHYAVDFDGDGRRDLWDSTADAVASIANYLSEHGWRRGEPVTVPAKLRKQAPDSLLERGYKPSVPLRELEDDGVVAEAPVDGGRKAGLIELEGENGSEHWLVFHNFYVITRYNHSPLYAMAVYQLARAIEDARGSTEHAVAP